MADDAFFAPHKRDETQAAKRPKTSNAIVEYEADGIRMTVNAPPPPPEPAIVVSTPVSLKTFMNKKNLIGEPCWGCMKLRRPTNPEKQKHHWKIWTLYDDSKNRMHDDAVYERIAEYYKTDMEDAARAQGKSPMSWPVDMVRIHFTYHIVDPKFIFAQKIRRLNSVLEALEDNILEESAGGKVKVAVALTEPYYKGIALLNGMMKTEISKIVNIA